MRLARRAAGLALLTAAVSILALPGGADATELTQVGWWWRVEDGSLPATLPAPPTVPEGGLMVAGAPDGATAIAALHFELADDEVSPVLTLTVADGGDQGGEGAILAACLTGSAWQPASPGAWTSKPAAACAEGSVTGVRSDDGTAWSFALAPLLSDGVVDVTLVPGVDPTLPEGANGSVFQLVFAAPTSASLETTAGGGPSPDLALPDLGAFVASGGGGPDAFAAPTLGGELALPPVDAAASFTPALPQADQGLTATAPVVQERNAPLATSPVTAIEDHRGLAIAVLVLAGAALLWGANQAGAGRAGSGLDSARVAGVGRFARARSGPVPRL